MVVWSAPGWPSTMLQPAGSPLTLTSKPCATVEGLAMSIVKAAPGSCTWPVLVAASPSSRSSMPHGTLQRGSGATLTSTACTAVVVTWWMADANRSG